MHWKVTFLLTEKCNRSLFSAMQQLQPRHSTSHLRGTKKWNKNHYEIYRPKQSVFSEIKTVQFFNAIQPQLKCKATHREKVQKETQNCTKSCHIYISETSVVIYISVIDINCVKESRCTRQAKPMIVKLTERLSLLQSWWFKQGEKQRNKKNTPNMPGKIHTNKTAVLKMERTKLLWSSNK